MTRIRIENVVASTSLGDKLDLASIAIGLPGAEYQPDQFPGLIYRMHDPKTAVLLFQSGKVVCTGGRSMQQVVDSIKTISGLIRREGQKVSAHPKIEIQNIVATSDVGGEINLHSVAVALGLDRVEYEPEQFPGLVYRLPEPRVVLLLFGSGKLVCTGARRPSDLGLAVDRIVQELRRAELLGRERAAAPEPAKPLRRPDRPSPRSSARPTPPSTGVPPTSPTGMTA